MFCSPIANTRINAIGHGIFRKHNLKNIFILFYFILLSFPGYFSANHSFVPLLLMNPRMKD